jgi:hypothetical protein
MAVTTAIWKTSAASSLARLPDDVYVADNLSPTEPGILPHSPAINTKPFIKILNATSKPNAFPISFDLGVSRFVPLDENTIYTKTEQWVKKQDIEESVTKSVTVTTEGGGTGVVGSVTFKFATGEKVKKFVYENSQNMMLITSIRDNATQLKSAVEELENHLNSLVNNKGPMSMTSTAKLLKTARDVDPTITNKEIRDFYSIVYAPSIASIKAKVDAAALEYTTFVKKTSIERSDIVAFDAALKKQNTTISAIIAPNKALLQRAQAKLNQLTASTGLLEIYGKSDSMDVRLPSAEVVEPIVQPSAPVVIPEIYEIYSMADYCVFSELYTIKTAEELTLNTYNAYDLMYAKIPFKTAVLLRVSFVNGNGTYNDGFTFNTTSRVANETLNYIWGSSPAYSSNDAYTEFLIVNWPSELSSQTTINYNRIIPGIIYKSSTSTNIMPPSGHIRYDLYKINNVIWPNQVGSLTFSGSIYDKLQLMITRYIEIRSVDSFSGEAELPENAPISVKELSSGTAPEDSYKRKLPATIEYKANANRFVLYSKAPHIAFNKVGGAIDINTDPSSIAWHPFYMVMPNRTYAIIEVTCNVPGFSASIATYTTDPNMNDAYGGKHYATNSTTIHVFYNEESIHNRFAISIAKINNDMPVKATAYSMTLKIYQIFSVTYVGDLTAPIANLSDLKSKAFIREVYIPVVNDFDGTQHSTPWVNSGMKYGPLDPDVNTIDSNVSINYPYKLV